MQEILFGFGSNLLVEPITHNPHNVIPNGKAGGKLVECGGKGSQITFFVFAMLSL